MTSLALLALISVLSLTEGTQDQDEHLRMWSATGQTEAVRKLLAEEVDVGARDDQGWTALMHAAKGGHAGVVQLLLEAGANVYSENNDGDTPLHIAAQHGRVEVVRLLLDAGADYEAQDANGHTPLYRAFENRQGKVVEMIQAAAQASFDRARASQKGPALETLPPKVIESDPAEYPDEALEQEVEGTVVLMVLVRRDGAVGPVNVSESLEESLDRSAVKAVKKWHFTPATRGGQPVEVVVEVKIDFELPKEPGETQPGETQPGETHDVPPGARRE